MNKLLKVLLGRFTVFSFVPEGVKAFNGSTCRGVEFAEILTHSAPHAMLLNDDVMTLPREVAAVQIVISSHLPQIVRKCFW